MFDTNVYMYTQKAWSYLLSVHSMKWPLDAAHSDGMSRAYKWASMQFITKLSVVLEYFAGWKIVMIKEGVFFLFLSECVCVFVHLYQLGITLTLVSNYLCEAKPVADFLRVWIKFEW